MAELQQEHDLLQATSSTALSSLATVNTTVEERNVTIMRLQRELHQATTALAAAQESAAAGTAAQLLATQHQLRGANNALAFAQEEAEVARSEATAAISARDIAQSRLTAMNARMLAMFDLSAEPIGAGSSVGDQSGQQWPQGGVGGEGPAGGQGAAGGQGGAVEGEWNA